MYGKPKIDFKFENNFSANVLDLKIKKAAPVILPKQPFFLYNHHCLVDDIKPAIRNQHFGNTNTFGCLIVFEN